MRFEDGEALGEERLLLSLFKLSQMPIYEGGGRERRESSGDRGQVCKMRRSYGRQEWKVRKVSCLFQLPGLQIHPVLGYRRPVSSGGMRRGPGGKNDPKGQNFL